MRKHAIGVAVALLLAGVVLPVWGQYGGRTITRETMTEPGDFIKEGGHVVNKAYIAYVAKSGNQSVVHFIGGAQPLTLFGPDMASIAQQLVPVADPNLPQLPNVGRSPFELDAPKPSRTETNRRPATPEVNPRPVRPSPSSPARPAPEETPTVGPLDPGVSVETAPSPVEPTDPLGPALSPIETNPPVSLPSPGTSRPSRKRAPEPVETPGPGGFIPQANPGPKE